MTALVGREEVIAEAASMLRRAEVRLLTITGPGGVGKTRVAEAVAVELAEDFADGVVVVHLDTVRDPGLVVGTIARVVGVLDVEGDLTKRLVEHLEPRQMLLVVDNFEQVVEAAPVLAAIVETCPSMKVTVTSRTRLHLTVEHELQLEPLGNEDAVRLFVERASAARPDFARGEMGRDTISEICNHLDRLPLAIELAAARVRILPPETMLSRLENRLELLTSGPRDAARRHQALRDTIGWSFELLDDDQRELFRRMGAFVGGCTLDAIEEVGAADLDTVAALVDHSLVRSEGDRFVMLETIREYAADVLAERADSETIRRRHAAHYVALAEAAGPRLTGPDQARSRGALEADRDNIRAALRFSLDHGDVDTALRLCASLWRFWLDRGYLSEGRVWLDEALSASGASSSLRARVLTGDGVLSHYQGDYARADDLCREALALSRSLDDDRAAADALTGLAVVRRSLGDYAEAEALYREALASYERLGDEAGVVRALDRLGIALAVAGDNERARPLFERALELSRGLGDSNGIALALHGLAFVRPPGGQARAQAQADESLAILRGLGDRRNVSRVLWSAADVSADLGDSAAAAAYLEESLTLCAEFGDPWFCGVVLEEAAVLAAATGDVDRAARLFGAAEAVRAGIGAPLPAMYRVDHDRVVPEVRSALGDEPFTEAWEQGGRLPLRATVELIRPLQERVDTDASEGLTAREVEVLAHVAQGLTDAEVAEELVVSLRTVHAHLRSVYRKLDVHTRSAATRYALEHGFAA